MRRIVALAAALATMASVGATLFIIGPTKVSLDAIRSSVLRSENELEKAWELPAAATFERKVAWQSNPSMCGPASVANAMRSLRETATSEDAVLSGTGRCWSGICFMGLTLDELAEVTRLKTKRTVTVLRNLSAEEFRHHLRLSNDPQRRYIINFNRKSIFGAGVGHHSPIGGYLESEDMVFVLDVNREFRPWLVERSRLFAAMDTWDGDRKRGLLLIE
jgi:hypothetical protein